MRAMGISSEGIGNWKGIAEVGTRTKEEVEEPTRGEC